MSKYNMKRKLLYSSRCMDGQIKTFLDGETFGIGVLIGKLTDDKDFLFHCAKLSEQVDDNVETESDEVDSMAGDSPKSSPTKDLPGIFDDTWLIEFGRQVCRLLPGGLQIIGIFICSSSSYLDTNSALLKTCIRNLFKATERNKFLPKSNIHSCRYQLHIDTETRRINCHSIDVLDQQDMKSLVEMTDSAVVYNLCEVSSSIYIHERFHIPKAKEKSRIGSQTMSGMTRFINKLWNATAIEGDTVINGTDPIVKQSKGKGSQQSKDNKVNFNLLLASPEEAKPTEDNFEYDHCGVIAYQGWMELKAYVPIKSTKQDALESLKQDGIRSLLARSELLFEEAEVNNMIQVKEWSLVSPRRLFAPLSKETNNPIMLCDYSFKEESVKNTVQRFSALLGIKINEEDVEITESWPDDTMINQAEEDTIHYENTNSNSNNNTTSPWYISSSCFLMIIGAFFVALMAALFAK